MLHRLWVLASLDGVAPMTSLAAFLSFRVLLALPGLVVFGTQIWTLRFADLYLSSSMKLGSRWDTHSTS